MTDQQTNSEVNDKVIDEIDSKEATGELEKPDLIEEIVEESEEPDEIIVENIQEVETQDNEENKSESPKADDETYAEETTISEEPEEIAAFGAVAVSNPKKRKIRRRRGRGFLHSFTPFEMTMIVLGIVLGALLISAFTYLYMSATKSAKVTPKTGIIASDTDKSWLTRVVNSSNGLPAEFAVATSYVTGSQSVQVDSRATKETVQMLADLKEAVPDEDVTLAAGYMSIPQLQQAKEDAINRLMEEEDLSYSEAVKQAETMVKPGTDEHSLGLLINFSINGSINPEAFKTSQSYEWLKNNAWKYGYIERYPEGKESVTQHPYDASAFRYVGQDNAENIYENGYSLEEYNAAVAQIQAEQNAQAQAEAQAEAQAQAEAEAEDEAARAQE